MRTLLLAVALLILPVAAHAQLPPWYNPYQYGQPHRPYVPQKPALITVGGYFSLGLESHDTSTQTTQTFVPIAGIFVDYCRHAIRPGLDLRGEGGVSAIRGTLVGPRISAQYSVLRPYAEFLAGPNHYQTDPAQISVYGPAAPSSDIHGLTVKGVIGLDIDYNSAVSWRVVEYTQGNFNGMPNSHPQTFSTGIVFRVP